MRYLIIIIGAVLVNNFVLNRFLGCCPFLGVSKKTETALGMSGAVVFVMTIAAAVTWCLDHVLLQPGSLLLPQVDLSYIHTLAFILVIAALVQFIDIAMKRFLPPLHAALGIFLPHIPLSRPSVPQTWNSPAPNPPSQILQTNVHQLRDDHPVQRRQGEQVPLEVCSTSRKLL